MADDGAEGVTKAPKISKARGRSVTEWIGKTPDTWPPPPHVLLRILRRHDHTCYITKMKIPPGVTPEFDHIVELEDGGENRESNIAPVLPAAHKVKSADARKRRAKADAAAKKAAGIKPEPVRPLQSRNDLAGRPKAEKPKKERKAYVDPFEGLGRPGIFRRMQQ